jgi:succinate dehydrogenase / fumarate reductase cytochrome b subunit
MTRAACFLNTTVGNKIIMAVTGLLMFGFVIVHMIGNLQLYFPAVDGVQALDSYAKFLDETAHGALKWGTRAVLLVAVALHVRAHLMLAALQGKARPTPYAVKRSLASTVMSRTMKLTGPVILAFIVFHLLHLTVGAFGSYEHGKVFQNVTTAFKNPAFVGIYVVAQLALAPHLSHGGYSLFRSLGLEDAPFAGAARKGAMALAAVVTLANVSFPLSVLLGFVG